MSIVRSMYEKRVVTGTVAAGTFAESFTIHLRPNASFAAGILGSLTSTTRAIKSTVTAYPASQWGESAHHFVVTAANPRNEMGAAGYFETDVTGTVAGTLYGFGSWVNFNTTGIGGSEMICAQDNGIYGAATATLTSAKLVIGMRMECVIDGGANPGSLFLFSTNIYDNALTAIFDVNAKADFGWVTAACATGAGHIPFLKEVSTGTVLYINVYTS